MIEEWNVCSNVELREGARIPESYINGAYSKNICSCVELREGARTPGSYINGGYSKNDCKCVSKVFYSFFFPSYPSDESYG